MDSPLESAHAGYDRWVARRERWGRWWRRLGQIAFLLVAGVLAVVFALLFIASLVDLGQPRVWGTFTQTDCEPRLRGGCRPVGIWVSDDRAIVLRDVDLDGWTDGTGTVRASYQPTALLGENIVHVPAFSGTGPWVIGGVLIWWVGYTLYKAASWGCLRVPGVHWLGGRSGPRQRQGVLGIRGSFRRQYRRSLERGDVITEHGDE